MRNNVVFQHRVYEGVATREIFVDKQQKAVFSSRRPILASKHNNEPKSPFGRL